MGEPKAFYYETEVEWKKEREGQIKGLNLPAVGVGAPPEFKGREGQWTPEHLFVASILGNRQKSQHKAGIDKLPLVSFFSTAKGRLEKVPRSSYQITEIVVQPRVVIKSVEDLGRIGRLLEKAKENCFISSSIKSTVKVEPQIFHEQTPGYPCPLGGDLSTARASTR
jgi:organic hydroperoxide reductase OsmC/OhrA